MGISTSPASGSRGQVSIGEETNFGVAVPPTHLIAFTSETLAATENVLQSESIRSDRGVHQLIRGTLSVEGDLSFEQSCSGFGMQIRHALGDYIKVADADGGVRARMARAAKVAVAASGGDIPVKEWLVLSDEASTQFDASGTFAIVHRDANDALALDHNTTAGYAYDEMNLRLQTYVDTIDLADTGSSYTDSMTKLTLAAVYDGSGGTVNPPMNSKGGIVHIGADRTEYIYAEANELGAGLGTEIWIHPSSFANGTPLANDTVIALPCLASPSAGFSGLPTSPEVQIGSWVYQYDNTELAGVITHHIERGKNLPVGLTIEVDRDAAIFLYTGCKTNTMVMNFESNAVVTGTFTYVGRQEHAMAELISDVVPGALTIDITDGTAFPSDGFLTIGEETDIEYTAKVDNADGSATLTIALTPAQNLIQRHHVKGQNVDSRSSTAVASPEEGNNSPLSSFEIGVFVDGYWEEALSASVTLNNNINADKYILGSRYRAQAIEQRTTIEANLNLEFDDGKHYLKFINGNNFALEIKCVSEADDSLIGTTGVYSQAYYFMPKCKFNGTTPNVSDDSYITHDMPISAIVDDAGRTTDLVVVLVNDNTNDVEAP